MSVRFARKTFAHTLAHTHTMARELPPTHKQQQKCTKKKWK